ncbi:helix-turn-helix transcriptional regulator [Nocardioides panacisoli]|uniref:AAA family ATPase n=1 Tax=Nocardioides panacisoli TaxID=627624 RepID=A0ABP7IUD4_9ACTN
MSAVVDLLERDAALARVDELAGAARAGEGQALAIVAPAGVGKTSLLAAIRDRLVARGHLVLSASGTDRERSLPHATTRSLLEPALTDPGLRADVLRDAAVPAAAILGGAAAPGPLQHSLYWTVANLAAHGPLALLVDDAHECDDASIDFLGYLARRVTDLPVIIVAALRPAAQVAWSPALEALHRDVGELQLPPLTDGAAAVLLGRLMNGPVSRGFIETCVRATGGNPFYLTELARDLERRGIDPSGDQLPHADTIAPPAIVRSVLLQMAVLAPAAPRLAHACAVLGDGCRLDHAAQLAEVPIDEAATAADALVASGVLVDDAGGLRLAHPILRASVLGDVGRHERARWHARAAAVLRSRGAPVGVVATHLKATEPAGDPETADLLLQAGEQALGAGSPHAAVALLRRARDEPPSPAAVGDVEFRLGVAEAQVGDLAAIEHLVTGIRLADDPDTATERALLFAELARKASLVPLAVDALDTVLASTRSTRLRSLAAADRYWIGRTSTTTYARVRGQRGDLDRALAHPDAEVSRVAACHLATEAAVAGPLTDLHRYLDLALAPPGLLAHISIDSAALAGALFALTVGERHADHDALTTEVLEKAGRTGNWVAHVLATIYRGIELPRLGQVGAAATEVSDAMALATEAGWPMGSAELPAVQVAARLWIGDVAGAADVVADVPFDLANPTTVPVAMLLHTRGEVALRRHDPRAALGDATAAGACLEQLAVRNPAITAWRRTASAALRVLGEQRRATELAEEELGLARSMSGPAVQAGSLRALAALVPGPEAVELLAEADGLVAGGPALLERALVAYELGAALRRTGRPTDARRHLAAALDLADRCGGTALAASAREEIALAGGRPRRTRVTGVAALTPAESRVVRLAAKGTTNTVIAQTLFVSRKTVEKQLASAYGKLGISSRAGLAQIDLSGLESGS